jgi:hypothetical protein
VGAALAAAALSLAWDAIPQFDPQGWLLWGREVVFGTPRFDTAMFPSWKPLALVVTAPLAPASAAAPALLLVITRAGALLGLVLAARLATRAGGAPAGLLAPIGIVLLPGWLALAADGHLEPLLLALVLLAAKLHADGRRRSALLVLAAVALARVEAWPAVVAYALLLIWRDRRSAPIAIAVLAAIPLAWFGGDWLGSGDPFRAGNLARHAATTAAQAHSGHPRAYAVGVAADLLTLPLWLGAALAALDGLRRRRLAVPALAALALSWFGVDVVLAGHGYPADPRFMLPAGGVLCVVAGVGGGVLLRRLPRRAVRLGAAGVLAAALAPGLLPRVGALPAQASETSDYSQLAASLDRALATLGGRAALARCPRVSANQLLQTRLAWDLQRNVSAVRRRWGPRVLVITREPRRRGHRARLLAGLRALVLGHEGRFWIVALTWRRHSSDRALGPGCLRALSAARTRAPPS